MTPRTCIILMRDGVCCVMSYDECAWCFCMLLLFGKFRCCLELVLLSGVVGCVVGLEWILYSDFCARVVSVIRLSYYAGAHR